MNTSRPSGILALFSISAVIFCSCGQKSSADALDNWAQSQVVTNPPGYYGSTLSGLAYGNGHYVAVGAFAADDSGVVQTSQDGIHWTRLPYYSLLDLYDVAFANGTFVAVGWDYYYGGNLYNSTNGADWASHTNATVSNFYGVTYGGGLFVAVGDGLLPNSSTFTNRQIYTSPDGITWTGRTSGSPAADVHTIYSVAYGSGRFVAAGGGYLYASTTGTAWTRSYNANASGPVNYCNGLFIISSGPGTDLVSTDGSTWSLLANNTSSTFGRVIYNNRLYVALAGSMLFTSSDATNWTQRSVPVPANGSLAGIAFGDHNLVAVGFQLVFPGYSPLAYISDALAAIAINGAGPLHLGISGLQSRSYRIEYVDALQPAINNWLPLTTLSLTNSPLLWTDSTATNSQRFYRAVLLP